MDNESKEPRSNNDEAPHGQTGREGHLLHLISGLIVSVIGIVWLFWPDGERGLIPMTLILLGAFWYVFARYRGRRNL